jgi:hypothetical protein
VERRTEEGERRNKMTKGGRERERKSLELGCTVYSTNQGRGGGEKIKSKVTRGGRGACGGKQRETRERAEQNKARRGCNV